jgi:transposase
MQAESSVGCLMGIRFCGFGRANSCVAFSVIRMSGSSPLIAAQKTVCGCCGRVQLGWFDRKMRTVRDLPAAGFRILLELAVRRIACQACDSVKRDRVDFLAENPRFTKRFAIYVRRRRRQAAFRHVAD